MWGKNKKVFDNVSKSQTCFHVRRCSTMVRSTRTHVDRWVLAESSKKMKNRLSENFHLKHVLIFKDLKDISSCWKINFSFLGNNFYKNGKNWHTTLRLSISDTVFDSSKKMKKIKFQSMLISDMLSFPKILMCFCAKKYSLRRRFYKSSKHWCKSLQRATSDRVFKSFQEQPYLNVSREFQSVDWYILRFP